jgi:phage shock protein A
MGVMSRLLRLCKADLHGVMDRIEDQDLLLKQYLREMEDALAADQKRLENLKARRTQAERTLAVCRERLGALEADIALAVAKEKDDIARMLIRKKYPLGRQTADLETRLFRMRADIEAGEAAYAQRLAALGEIRQRAAAVAGGRGMSPGSVAGDPFPADAAGMPGEAEIELELLQCKEALGAGRSS